MKYKVLTSFMLYLLIAVSCFTGCLDSSNRKIEIPFESQDCSIKELSNYIIEQINKDDSLNKYDFAVSKVYVSYKDERTNLTFIEKNSKDPKIVVASLEWTTENFMIQFFGSESKLNKGVINIADWSIDSTDLEQILINYWSNHTTDPDIDITTIDTSSYYGENEDEVWFVYYYMNEIYYNAVIDPYSGLLIKSVLLEDT